MFNYIKRQWLRFKSSWQSFKNEWKFNHQNKKDHELVDNSFTIMGLGRLRDSTKYPDPSFDMKPPYYGQTLTRLNGHTFTLKHTHYNPTTGVVRYLNTDQPQEGFIVLTPEWLEK